MLPILARRWSRQTLGGGNGYPRRPLAFHRGACACRLVLYGPTQLGPSHSSAPHHEGTAATIYPRERATPSRGALLKGKHHAYRFTTLCHVAVATANALDGCLCGRLLSDPGQLEVNHDHSPTLYLCHGHGRLVVPVYAITLWWRMNEPSPSRFPTGRALSRVRRGRRAGGRAAGCPDYPWPQCRPAVNRRGDTLVTLAEFGCLAIRGA